MCPRLFSSERHGHNSNSDFILACPRLRAYLCITLRITSATTSMSAASARSVAAHRFNVTQATTWNLLCLPSPDRLAKADAVSGTLTVMDSAIHFAAR